ncbi:MAG: globin [Gammaproteobacteria bacterium]|nr:globin [Gammaproteobacteria bacterium]
MEFLSMARNFTQAKTSLGRCINSGNDLFGKFYDIFLVSHPSISPRFANTDMSAQKALLKNGINLAIMYAEGNPIGASGISRIRDTHSATKMNIEPGQYSYWLDSFIKAVSETDPQFGPEIEKEWRELLQMTINHITSGYGK